MKQTIKSIAAMALAILAMFSCQKDSLQNDGLREEGGDQYPVFLDVGL